MRETGGSERNSGLFEDFQSHRGIAFFRDEFGGIVGREFVFEEIAEFGGDVFQQMDSFTDERGNEGQFLGRCGDERRKIGGEFYIKMAAFLAGPVVGVLTTQFPSIADSVLGWLQPGLDAFK